MKTLLMCLITFLLKTTEVTFGSLKLILITKSKRVLSAAFAFVETLIWAIVVSTIVSDITSKPFVLLSYCLGNAFGYIMGSLIENKIALGTVNLQIISEFSNREKITEVLDKYSVGYTVTVGEGAKDTNCTFSVITKRKIYRKIIEEISENISGCFFAVNEVSKTVGGH